MEKILTFIFALIRVGVGLVFGLLVMGSDFVTLGLQDAGWQVHNASLGIKILFFVGVIVLPISIFGVLGFYSVRLLRPIAFSLSRLPKRIATPLVVLVILGSAVLFFGIKIQREAAIEVTRAERSCVSWFRDPEIGGRDPFVADTWRKERHIVVKIGFDKNGTSYSTALCVYNLARGAMSKPNAFERGSWN